MKVLVAGYINKGESAEDAVNAGMELYQAITRNTNAEDEFGISIPDEMIPQIKTIKDIVEFIETSKK